MRSVLFCAFFFLSACVSKVPVPSPEPTPSEVETPVGAPGEMLEKKYPSTGWHSDFDEYIMANATKAMLEAPASRMSQFCAEWATLTKEQRREFWADLFFSIAKPESNYNWATMYWEEDQGKDSVTGLTVKTSEGPLQLSYSDVNSYGPSCDFDYNHDRPFHLQDIEAKPTGHSWKSKFPQDKYILHPVRNLRCGIAIADRLLRSEKRAGTEFADLMGAYWATMRRLKDGKPRDSYAAIWKQMRSRQSPCH